MTTWKIPELNTGKKTSIKEHKLNWLTLAGLAHLCPLRRGFLKLIQLVLKTRADGLIHCGPPCSSWVWVNRATSKRSRDSPAGDASIQSVAYGNSFLGFKIVDLIKHHTIQPHIILIEFLCAWKKVMRSDLNFQGSKSIHAWLLMVCCVFDMCPHVAMWLSFVAPSHVC